MTTWSTWCGYVGAHIIQVVGSDPFNKVVMAKQIGEEYGMHWLLCSYRYGKAHTFNSCKWTQNQKVWWPQECYAGFRFRLLGRLVSNVKSGSVIDDLRTLKHWWGSSIFRRDTCLKESEGATWEKVVHVMACKWSIWKDGQSKGGCSKTWHQLSGSESCLRMSSRLALHYSNVWQLHAMLMMCLHAIGSVLCFAL